MEDKGLIWITAERPGFHFWKDAPDKVSFLRNPHRHIFKFKVFIEILEHNDREIEFFMFKEDVEKMIKRIWIMHGLENTTGCGMSCEMISDELFNYINELYPNRDIAITVSEDGENGSHKMYPKSQSI